MKSEHVLRVSNVSKSYGKNRALDNVSFEIESGFHALLGPNGAGKSTLFQLLTGLFTPDEGNIHINDINVSERLPEALAQMGVVFQQPALDLDLTVQRNMDFYGKLHGMSQLEIRDRAAEELAQLQLSDVVNRPCRELSGGNRRKVELARALMTHPALLLMDEATVGLDPASRSSLLEYVHGLCASRNMTVLWATHLMDEADNARQVIVLNKGKLLAQATAEQLMEKTGKDSLLEAFFALSGESGTSKTAAL